ncbi:hypothetical protein JYG23_05380 [Sedimentibacter sp. zth1]|uniref:YlmH family RNA-binding protein n=1 Tax=Sedimentibacter sp. zth1 TaxID=2816908 RepID=UPI001A939DD6|nr:YlmH/Sll1252 family protein [Sedimentibacter sp. zth1]QSX06880.1 hypothetical protein JYG23_05380 [Sedimentibacter sp. zth1]
MKDFNKYYDYIQDEETRLLVRKVVDKAKLVSKNYVNYASDFINDNVLNYCLPLINNEDISYKLFPTYEHSERKSLILFPDYISEDDVDAKEYFTAYRLYNKSKFKDLDHNNYLGSLMSLGIDRSKIGDIYVHDEFADIICNSDISDVIIYNLDKVGNNKIDIKQIELEDISYKESDHENIIINVTSLRLDNVVKSLINKSRDICNDLISSGNVKINFEVVKKPTFIVSEKDLISIRRFGRFMIEKEIGSTKSGKIKLDIKHYIRK